DDPTIRLTTNVVGIEPDAVTLGLRVRVRFEAAEDVWIPLFEPTDEPLGEWAVAEPAAVSMPRPVSSRRFEHDGAITGIGISEVGRRLMRPPLSLTVDACLAAVADAGLELSDIDGVATYPGMAAAGHSEGGASPLIEALRLTPTWHNGAPETPGQIGALVAGLLAVSAGLCRHVLCFRTVWEATFAQLQRSGEVSHPGGRRASGMAELRAPFGALSAANWIALAASQHFARYGTTKEQLGAIAVNARANAARNPLAVYRDPLTLEDYLEARPITTPFGLYDCDVPCDGAVAVVISARDAARDRPRPPVLVDAVGTAIADRLSWDQGTLTHEPQVVGPAAHLWSRTELRPADVDLAQLYDGFTFNCLSWLEALGFCGMGEGGPWLEGGKRIALDGELPLNTGGGQLSAGRLHGFGLIHEAVVQLRGDGGERQVPGAEVALVTTGGGTPGGCALFTVAR
ncbi:MAG: thiolase family protein, partial [Acidimicrobiales bacterium]|nr:thiolase family protein [Acidimicrobiales bacterium]